MTFIKEKLEIVVYPMITDSSVGGFHSKPLVLQHSIPKSFSFPNIGSWIEPLKRLDPVQNYGDTVRLSKESHIIVNKLFLEGSPVRSHLTDSKPFFKTLPARIKLEPLPDYCNGCLVENSYNQLDLDLTVLEKSLESQVIDVNHYILTPSVETLKPLVEKSSFFSQVPDSSKDLAVKNFFEVVAPDNLLDAFTSLIQLNSSNMETLSTKFSYYNNIMLDLPAVYDIDINVLKQYLGGMAIAFHTHSLTVIGFLGFLSDNFNLYPNPEVLILPPVVFVSSVVWLKAMNRFSLDTILTNPKGVLSADFVKVFLESMQKTNGKILRSFMIWKSLGLIKSKPVVPWYLKFVKIIGNYPVSISWSFFIGTSVLCLGYLLVWAIEIFF